MATTFIKNIYDYFFKLYVRAKLTFFVFFFMNLSIIWDCYLAKFELQMLEGKTCCVVQRI